MSLCPSSKRIDIPHIHAASGVAARKLGEVFLQRQVRSRTYGHIHLSDQGRARAVQELKDKIEVAAGAHAAYQSLNACGTAQLGQYSYKICPFGDATQGHVSRQIDARLTLGTVATGGVQSGAIGPLEGLGE